MASEGPVVPGLCSCLSRCVRDDAARMVRRGSWRALALFVLLFACSSTHELLTPMDGGVDAVDSSIDSGSDGALPDASACGSPPPPAAPCHCVGPASVVDGGAISCSLSQEEIVESAVRLSACDVATANDVIAGYFELQLALPSRSVSPGYVPDCDVVRCGASSSSCTELATCIATARESECTPTSLAICVGTEVWQCGVDAAIRLGDCATIGGTCALEPTSGDREIAYCETPGNPGPVIGSTWCDRDELVVNVGGESVRFACSEYLPGTECRDILFASEFPGVACGYPDPVCSEYAAVSCSGAFAELCVGGQPRLIDCVAEGYSGCEFGAGCVE